MMFSKTNDIYKITRMIGSQNNLLGISFTEVDNEPIEIIEWNIESEESIKTSKSEVKSQVLARLRKVNGSLKTNYRVSKIYFVPQDNSRNSVYDFLIQNLVKHLHSGQVFREIEAKI